MFFSCIKTLTTFSFRHSEWAMLYKLINACLTSLITMYMIQHV